MTFVEFKDCLFVWRFPTCRCDLFHRIQQESSSTIKKNNEYELTKIMREIKKSLKKNKFLCDPHQRSTKFPSTNQSQFRQLNAPQTTTIRSTDKKIQLLTINMLNGNHFNNFALFFSLFRYSLRWIFRCGILSCSGR